MAYIIKTVVSQKKEQNTLKFGTKHRGSASCSLPWAGPHLRGPAPSGAAGRGSRDQPLFLIQLYDVLAHGCL